MDPSVYGRIGLRHHINRFINLVRVGCPAVKSDSLFFKTTIQTDKYMRRTITMALAALLLSSCIYEDLSDCPNYNGSQSDSTSTKIVPVEFSIATADSTLTRSSISVSETAVEDLNIYAYYNGTLETSAFIESPTSFTMELIKGRSYKLYVLANMGEVEAPHKESAMSGHCYSISRISDISGSLPMAWNEAYTVSGSSSKVSVSLERLISRIRFSIDKSSLDDFSVTAVKLRQGALKMYPFSSGSKAESTSDVGDGDYATSSDLSTLNSGGTVTFYALENCQGVLLPGNTDPESKNPDEISDHSSLCTYLEMTASYSGQYEGVDVSSDNVVYRFYIGEDNCTDFNVRRNNDLKIHLNVTEERIFDDRWKVSYGEDLPTITYGLENSKTSVSLNVGGSTALSASYYRVVDGTRDSSSDVTSYTAWTSSNTSVATVSGGKVTAVGAGTTTITATYNGYRATTTVTVSNVMGYALELSRSTLSVQAESTAAITAYYVTYTNGVETSRTNVTSSATWKTSMSSIVTVSGGAVTGVSAGQAVVTATYRSYSKSCTVTVTAKPITYTYKLVVSLADSSIDVGEATTATATYITYADGVQSSSKDVTSSATWTSGNTTVATVSAGTITGKASGSSAIKASYNGYEGSQTITVNDVLTYGLEQSITSPSIYVGASLASAANYITFKNGTRSSSQTVTSSATWTSSDTSVATVSGGTITGVKAGTATITATYNGYSATAEVTVEDKITYDVYLSPASTTVVAGRTSKLTAVQRTFTNGVQTYGQDVSSSCTWASNNTAVATVSTNGVITGVSKGTATITAVYNGTTLTGTVTVTPAYTYELVLSSTSLSLNKGTNRTITATYKTYVDGVLESSANVTGNATWTSSSTSVATVSTQGVVTAAGVGNATITATYNGKSATCSVKVIGTPTLSMGWTSADMEKGDVRTNAAIYNPNDGTSSTNVTSNATWTTSNAGVATVGGGTITAQGKGTCTITATYNGVSASCIVNVTANDTPSANTYVSSISVQSVNISGTSNYKLTLILKFSDGTVVEDAPYTWSVTFAQNSAIATGTSGDTPIIYTGGGTTYTMAVTLTTKEYYYDSSGNRRQHTTGTSFSHNVNWTP